LRWDSPGREVPEIALPFLLTAFGVVEDESSVKPRYAFAANDMFYQRTGINDPPKILLQMALIRYDENKF
jgi:hypothetical protein